MPDKCRICGRPLKSPESVKAGIGGTCRRKMEGSKPSRSKSAPLAGARLSAGQIPLFESARVEPPKAPAITVVRRPPLAQVLPFESVVIIYPGGPNEPGEHYWTASAHVANVIGDLEKNPQRKWVIETLNAAVISKFKEELNETAHA